MQVKTIRQSGLIIFMISIILLLALDLFAKDLTELEQEIAKICYEYPSLCKERSRLSAYQPNYAIWQFIEDDENSLEAHYSIRYVFSNPDCVTPYKADEAEAKLKCLKSHGRRSEYFVTYTGEFNFYAFTRDSSPVINRISNPAFHYRKYLEGNSLYGFASLRWFDVAIEHRSDGQVIDADERIEDASSVNDGRYKAQVEFENGNHEYFDAISRGANFISIEGRFQIGGSHNNDTSKCKTTVACFDLWLSLKPIYLSMDSNVTWGSAKNRKMKFSDYDRGRLVLSNTVFTKNKFISEIEIGGEWTIGDELLDTDSINLNLILTLNGGIFGENTKIPLYIRYHNGPMNTLSDYTKEQESLGIGLRFK